MISIDWVGAIQVFLSNWYNGISPAWHPNLNVADWLTFLSANELRLLIQNELDEGLFSCLLHPMNSIPTCCLDVVFLVGMSVIHQSTCSAFHPKWNRLINF